MRADDLNKIAENQEACHLMERAEYYPMRKIHELGVSRIHKFISQKVPFLIISAHRHNYSRKQNDQRTKDLVSDLRGFGLGVSPLVGYWQEQGDEKPTKELAYFAIYQGDSVQEFEKTAQRLVSKYQQDAALFSNGSQIGLISGSGFKPTFKGVSFGDAQIKQAWSEIRGKKFTFLESSAYTGSVSGRQLWNRLGIFPDLMFASTNKKLLESLKT